MTQSPLCAARPLPNSNAFEPVVVRLLFLLIGLAFKLSVVSIPFLVAAYSKGAAGLAATFRSPQGQRSFCSGVVLDLAGSSGGPGRQVGLIYVNGPALRVHRSNHGHLWQSGCVSANQLLKRLLAYSTSPMRIHVDGDFYLPAEESAVLFYLVAYLVMNIGAFAIVAFIRNKTGSEELSAYKGLIQRSPIMAVALSLFFFSLLGVPPLVGFAAKFQIFRVLFDAGQIYASKSVFLSGTMYALLIIGGINTVISLVYYVRVIKIMVIDSPDPMPRGRLRCLSRWVLLSTRPFWRLPYSSLASCGIRWQSVPLRECNDSRKRRNRPGWLRPQPRTWPPTIKTPNNRG